MAGLAREETGSPAADHPDAWRAVFDMYDFRDAAGAFVQAVRRYVPTTSADPGETTILMPGFPRHIGADEVRKAVWNLGYEISFSAPAVGWSDVSMEAYVGFQWTSNLFSILVQRWKEPGTDFDFARGRLPRLAPRIPAITPQELDALTTAFEMVDRAIPEAEQEAARTTGMNPAWLYRAMRGSTAPAPRSTSPLPPEGERVNTVEGESSPDPPEPRDKRLFGKGGELDLECAAIARFLQHSDECWTILRLAKSLGCHPKSLTKQRCPQLHLAMATAKAVRARPRGSKDADTGRMEASAEG